MNGIQQARDHCLSGKGPVLIEAMTYRLGAHSTADDPSIYRKDEEVEEQEKKDPVVRLRNDIWKKKGYGIISEEKIMARR